MLVLFDFDHTVIDCNSDTHVPDELVPSIKEDFNVLSRTVQWTELMIKDCLKTCPMDPNMIILFKKLVENNHNVHIISDANSIFIETILEHYGVQSCVESIITNPCTITKHDDGTEYLMVTKLCGDNNKHSCEQCPVNMCKGEIVERMIKESNQPTAYVGDGSNDYCAVKKLSLTKDYIFARRGFALQRRLEKEISGDHVIFWNDWKELLDSFTLKNIIV
ncbi:pyridoxal phosphate phosphatase PHOSPHO2 [Acrasis kona]|uniref:Pyridoxal phosphate phosphatase PHOSPHO2 n=1 Tax=Acrasis kona TaxID=1008807 RepID=A0AAW2YWK8_9EUKA